jgi:hypothetical protein
MQQKKVAQVKIKSEVLKQMHFNESTEKWKTMEYFKLRTNAVWQFRQVISFLRMAEHDQTM